MSSTCNSFLHKSSCINKGSAPFRLIPIRLITLYWRKYSNPDPNHIPNPIPNPNPNPIPNPT